jgi:murein L,D-transpeptidase YafK
MKRIFGAMLCVIFLTTLINAKNFSFLKKYFENNRDKYIIYIKKGEKKLYLINSDFDDILECNIATGYENGKKICENDNRTPEGVYKITQIWQYEEPESLKNMKDDLAGTDKSSKKYAAKKKLYDMLYKEYLEGKASLERMNKVLLRAVDGHKKWGTNQDLGTDAYGPVFMRINYPNADDKKNYENEKKNKKSCGTPGSSIGIHGTNDEKALGHNATTGCIRLKNIEVMELSKYAKQGMTVVIEN